MILAIKGTRASKMHKMIKVEDSSQFLMCETLSSTYKNIKLHGQFINRYRPSS